jgi:pimeloyl-ACP methyl ester carboxylesterase
MTLRRLSSATQAGTAPLLLLHPLGVTSEFWDQIAADLSDLELLTLDLPGHGSSPLLPEGLSVRTIAEWVVELLTEAGLTKVSVVGVSLGGLIAQHLAGYHPDLVERLILVDTVPIYPEPVSAMWLERARLARESGPAQFAAPTLDTWFTKEAITRGHAEIGFVRDSIERMDAESYAANCEVLASADLTNIAEVIKAPTLIVCGDDDLPAFTQAADWFAEHLTSALPVAWIAPARHAAILELPAEFARAVHAFLSSPA